VTNDIDGSLGMADMLSTHKSQHAVEKGFRFLKSPDFLMSVFHPKNGAYKSPDQGHNEVFNGLCGIGEYDP